MTSFNIEENVGTKKEKLCEKSDGTWFYLQGNLMSTKLTNNYDTEKKEMKRLIYGQKKTRQSKKKKKKEYKLIWLVDDAN